jgi:hypothetical protein
MYDPTLGRFIERDPVGYAAGDPDLYGYAADRPAGESDPSGTRSTVTQQGTSAKDCKIIVTTTIDFSGEAATPANVAKVVKDIESHWNKGFRYLCCEVQFKIDAQIAQPTDDIKELLARKQRKGIADQIELLKGGPKANVLDVTTAGKFGENHGGTWYAQTGEQNDNFTWTPAHEYGHLLGLADRYGELGKPGRGKVHPGWADNIMGAVGQPVQQRNVTEVLDYVVANHLAGLKDYCCPPRARDYGKAGLALRYQGFLE